MQRLEGLAYLELKVKTLPEKKTKISDFFSLNNAKARKSTPEAFQRIIHPFVV
ncbi:MAG: hypothetical protein AAFP92_32230 [Bacteroidota bacterium]